MRLVEVGQLHPLPVPLSELLLLDLCGGHDERVRVVRMRNVHHHFVSGGVEDGGVALNVAHVSATHERQRVLVQAPADSFVQLLIYFSA